MDIDRRKLRALRRAAKATSFEYPLTLLVLDEAQHQAAIQRTAKQAGLVFFIGGLAVVGLYTLLTTLKPTAPVYFGPLALVLFAGMLGAVGYGVGLWMAKLNHLKDSAQNAGIGSLLGREVGFELRMSNGEVHEIRWADVQLVSFNIYNTQHGPFFQKAVLRAPLPKGEEAILTIDPMLWDNGPVLTAYVSDRLLDRLGQIEEADLPQ